MHENTPRLTVTNEGDVIVAELVDKKILDEVAITQIHEQLAALLGPVAAPKLVMDFARVAHMSSSALGMLITLHKRIREKQGELRLCGISPSIYEVFVITRLNEIFQISKTRPEALASL
ncbi:MAG: STAS domain-containing protein [Phycisphaerae bacterium]|nr:STAS domain-containing protein [Phycisphaerae bacterium]